MLLNHANVFEPVDLKRRFFRRVSADVAEGAAFGFWGRSQTRAFVSDNAARIRNEIILTNPVAQIAIGADSRLAMVNHRASALLGLADGDLGRPFQDLEISYRPLELRSQLAEVTESRAPVWLREVEWRRTGPDVMYVDVHLMPLLDGNGEVLGASISFTDVTRFRQLRVEVETSNRQLELAYEELQSTNEELETTNEELQSTVEELETTNEELQSTNEELTDLNAFMESILGSLESILGSLEAAVIVLDRDLAVQVW